MGVGVGVHLIVLQQRFFYVMGKALSGQLHWWIGHVYIFLSEKLCCHPSLELSQ